MKKKLWIVVIAALCLALVGALAACKGKTKIELNKTEITISEGEDERLIATTSDDSDVSWSSSNDSIATVSSRGVVTGQKAGEATITATSGKATATCKVTVKPKVIVNFTFKSEGETIETVELDRNGKETMQLEVAASDGSSVTSWRSSDENIVTVSNSGLVTAGYDGEATLTVRTDSGASGTIKVNVKDTFQGIKYALPKVDSKEAGKWWYHTEREGTTVNRAEYRGGVVTFDFDGINYYLYDIQLGLANDNSISAGWHKISFKLNSSFAASVTICGTRVDLVEGNNNVSVAYNQVAGADSFAIFFAHAKTGFVSQGKVVISDMKWEDWTPVTLKTPSFTLTNGNIEITDNENTEGVSVYEIGLFREDGTTSVESFKFYGNSGKLDTSKMEDKGTFIVKIRAVGNEGFNDSEWSTSNDITIEVDNGDVSYDMPQSDQDTSLSSGKWERWAGDGGSATKVAFANGTVTVEGTTSSWAVHGIQLFRHYAQYSNGTKLAISMKINTSVAGSITISDNVVALTEGDNNVTVYRTQTENKATIALLIGANPVAGNNIMGKEIVFKVSDVSVESFDEAIKLKAPSLTIADKIVTITDNENDAAAKANSTYELGFFAADAETPVSTMVMTDGGTINDSKIVDGTYTVKIRAVNKNIRYETSDWSETGVEYTVAHGEIEADVFEMDFSKEVLDATNESSTPNDQLSLWYVQDLNWNCGSVVTLTKTVDAENKTIGFTYSGGSTDWCVQLIYKNSHLKAGTNYKLTYKINVSKAMTVKINGQSKELVAGDNSVELNVTGSGTSFIIMFDQQTIDTTVTVSNVLWTEILA